MVIIIMSYILLYTKKIYEFAALYIISINIKIRKAQVIDIFFKENTSRNVKIQEPTGSSVQ